MKIVKLPSPITGEKHKYRESLQKAATLKNGDAILLDSPPSKSSGLVGHLNGYCTRHHIAAKVVKRSGEFYAIPFDWSKP